MDSVFAQPPPMSMFETGAPDLVSLNYWYYTRWSSIGPAESDLHVTFEESCPTRSLVFEAPRGLVAAKEGRAEEEEEKEEDRCH